MPLGTGHKRTHRFCKILGGFFFLITWYNYWIQVASSLKELNGRGSHSSALWSKVLCDGSGLPPSTYQGLVYS